MNNFQQENTDSDKLHVVLSVLTEWLDGGHEWSQDAYWLRDWVEGDKLAMKQARIAITKGGREGGRFHRLRWRTLEEAVAGDEDRDGFCGG